ncbi:NACHT domain-containing protein [Sphingobium phenoxybenzoativorans]|uniref:NACHT domain-containing protein n=1 Tax=Sphingobium phenoxybenzoativorans TaxID=1592790 RepID=UPI0009F60362|nr:NACHT domain-containing protein [Sphingobium phenoxybenzoativorans]
MTGIETAFAIAAAKESAKPAGRLLSAVGRRRYDAINVKYTNAFQDHMDQVIRKTSSVKNLIYKDQSANIKEKYVNIEFMQNDRKVSDLSVVEGLKNGQKFIVSGTAGAGKTMFMKWCSLELISSIINHQLIPLFLELREIGIKDDTENFCEFLFKNTSSIKNKATYNQFLEGIKSGIFVIILDAVDEINNEIRDDVLKSIRKMASAMPDVGMIVSTRPEPRIESIPEFSVLKTLPMSLSQIVQVLDKVDYNNDVKQKLIAELKSGLYKKHKSFLSNPLLATIMLLTYDQTAEIPTKVTSFYKQAFETLYQRHDATKGVYKRGHYAGLPMDEYERIFSAFCYRSYANSKFEFSDGELGKLFRDAVAYCQMDVEADLVVKDSMESVCLIQKEGLDNVFAHRSFQEYFTAIFVSLYRGLTFIK